MKNVFKIIVLVAVFTLSACSSSDSDNLGVAGSVLEGKVFGEAFKAKGGKAFLSGDLLSINITNIEADCNSSIFDYELYISAYAENKVGESNQVNVVFGKDGETPLNVLQSTVIIESISDSEVKGRIKSSSNEGNSVEGSFTVPFCQ